MVSRWFTQRRRVDFPAPDGPIRQTTWPFCTASVTSWSTCSAPYDLVIFSRYRSADRGAAEEATFDGSFIMTPRPDIVIRWIRTASCSLYFRQPAAPPNWFSNLGDLL